MKKIMGLESYPKFTMLCHSCQLEFKLQTTYEDIEEAICPVCKNTDVENLYISFPENGPGFQIDYNSEILR